MQSLITAVRENDDVSRYLAWPGDFDLDQGDHGEDVHLASPPQPAAGRSLSGWTPG
ncbi:hypothetical protein [Streptomyces sp. NPDC093109]|uniref:hypothetical protein n=1 Tax=Streptomyces sp. NPDC093109 TaxID=3154977 RepID=UPI00344EEC46